MAILTRDAILAAEDREYVVVDVPEWGGSVRLRSITVRERDRYEASLLEQKGKDRKVNLDNARAKLIILCAVDEEGRRLFTDADLAALARKSAKPMDRLYDACRKLCGISDDDEAELVEDFGAAQSDASGTD